MTNVRSSAITKIMIALPLALALIVFASCMPDCGLYLSTLDWASAYIQKYYYESVDPDDVRAAGLENLSGNVLDIYSRYYTAEEYRSTQASNSGSRSGIGVSYQLIPTARRRASRAACTSPRYRAIPPPRARVCARASA